MDKSKITSAILALQDSAETKNLDQGKQLYAWFLSAFATAHTSEEVRELLQKLNGTLASIEAHGHFTGEEYTVVLNLRELAQTKSSN